MFDPENSHSPQVKLILEWDRGFEKRDLDFLAKPLHKEFRYTVHPRSLGRPEKTKEEWLEYIAGITNLWTDHKVELCRLRLERPSLLNPSSAVDHPFHHRSPGEGYNSCPSPKRSDRYCTYLTWDLSYRSPASPRPRSGMRRPVNRFSSGI